jgi:non-specific serine/threonine protein kinase
VNIAALNGTGGAYAPRPREAPTVPGPATRLRGQLPEETTGFVGREAELTRLHALFGQARLITVTGPGGAGKTRLALHAAARAAPRFADGVCLVELAALRDPELLVPAVAAALGRSYQLERSGPPDGSRSDALLAAVGDRHLLLILDSCEHLVDACAMLAEAVIARAPRVTVLATSREPLDVSGENACPVGPLSVPEPGPVRPGDSVRPGDYRGTAVDLFVQRASAALPGFTLSRENLPDVIGLCRRLDGLPLALELAAVRLRALPLAELAGRLDHRLALLTSGHRGGRHRTLRDAISWSHHLCTPVERALWASLSVFAGPFTMSAAEQMGAGELDPGQVMSALIRLVDKSVLIRLDPADDTGQPGQYAQPTQYLMLETIREFGAEQLAARDAEDAVRNRFVRRYLAMARHFREHFLGDDQLPLLRELRREHANLTAALGYALAGQAGQHQEPPGQAGRRGQAGGPGQADPAADGVELATALSAYWNARGLVREGSHWLARAIERAPAGSMARADALLARGHLLTAGGSAADALADAARALAIADALGDQRLAAHGHLVRNAALGSAGQLTAAAEAGAEARRLLTALGDTHGLITLDLQHAHLALLNADFEAALGHVNRGLRLIGGSRERCLRASLYLFASLTLYLAGRDIESTWAATRALEAKHEARDTLGTAFALEVLGWLAAGCGREQRAAWLLGAAGPLWEQAGGRFAGAPAFARLHDEAAARSADVLGAGRFAEFAAQGAGYPLGAVVSLARSGSAAPGEGATASSGEDSPGQAGPAGPGQAGPAKLRLSSQLTAREQEIAGLVAAGLSNRQIAERLFISRRTVDAHLEHIFGKLRITSRVMLSIQLREHSAHATGDAGAPEAPEGLSGPEGPEGPGDRGCTVPQFSVAASCPRPRLPNELFSAPLLPAGQNLVAKAGAKRVEW